MYTILYIHNQIVPEYDKQEWTENNKYAGIFHFQFYRSGTIFYIYYTANRQYLVIFKEIMYNLTEAISATRYFFRVNPKRFYGNSIAKYLVLSINIQSVR